MTTLVGGVSELYQGDLDLGRHAAAALAGCDLGSGVLVEDLHYGAVAVAQRLGELQVSALVLVGAVTRGRPAGTVTRRRIDPPRLATSRAQVAVSNAVTGYVGIDLLVDVAAALRALPARTMAVEVEPATTDPAPVLSAVAERALPAAVALACEQVRRVPLLELADAMRSRMGDGRLETCAGLDALTDLLGALDGLDRAGHWGRTFVARDRLHLAIAAGTTSESMDHLDWAWCWGLLEELDRLSALEAVETADATDH